MKEQLHDPNLIQVKGDALKFVETCGTKFDIIFADPPYDLPDFATIPELVLNSQMLKSDTIFVIEHSKAYDFSHLPHFYQHRIYGKVNFTIFRLDDPE